MAIFASPQYGSFLQDYVVSGCVWTADSAGTNRNASMTAGVVCIGGMFINVAAVSARTFTASRDTYCDVDTTGTVNYSESTNNAASQALSANRIRLAIITTAAGSIAASGNVNQGQMAPTTPVVSSNTLSVCDSLGNLIYPTDPSRRLLGYRQITGNITATNQATATNNVTGLSCPIITPANTTHTLEITLFTEAFYSNTNAVSAKCSILDNTTEISRGTVLGPAVTVATPATIKAVVQIAASTSKTYNGGIWSSGASWATFEAASTYPGFIMVKLIS